MSHLDKAIIEGIRAGNQKFENILFERYRGIELFGNLRGEPQDVKFSIYIDTISDTILNIRKPKPPEIESLTAYVKGILIKKTSKFLKQKIKERETTIYIADIPYYEVPDTLLDTDDAETVQAFIDKAMDEISDKCRELLKAKYLDGLQFNAIAKKLGMPSTGAARVKKHDCLKSIRENNKDIIKKYYE